MLHQKLRTGFRCRLLGSKPQILPPGRKSWVSLRTGIIHCVPGLLPRWKMSGTSSIHLAAADGRMHGHLLGSPLYAHRF
ncbi:ankyrin repeat domain-containing protein 57 [Trichinella spiralis]|uniref:ankyrin repeat domain-containing protein 57 n=1 Tax=Trichinella spiralis TaxID=6334 RepID=UPI0001EFCD7E|nr:ankyrin repeat domain-containing protein 57 [Trichinella spiralis]